MSKFVPVRPPTVLAVLLRGSDFTTVIDVNPIVKLRNSVGDNVFAAFDAEKQLRFYANHVTPHAGGAAWPVTSVPVEMVEVLAAWFEHHGIIDLQDDPYREPLLATEIFQDGRRESGLRPRF